MEMICFDQISFLGGAESSNSAILDGKQLFFLLNLVFRRSRDLKIGYFRRKTVVNKKSGV